MNRIKFWLLSLSAAFFILQSCTKDTMDETGTVYTGPDLVEWAHLTGTMNRIIPFTVSGPAQLKDSVKIQLMGPQRTTPTTITFEIDAAGTTAVEGTDYIRLSHPANTAVIPAGQSFVWIVFNFIKPTVQKTLKMNLVTADEAGLSANYKSMTFTLRKPT